MIKKLLLNFIILACLFLTTSFSNELYQNGGKMINVAISSNDFKTIQHKEITLFATKNMQIYDEEQKKVLIEVPEQKQIKFVMNNGYFDIYDEEQILFEFLSGPFSISTEPEGLIGVEGLKRRNKQALYRGSFSIEKVPSKIDVLYLVNKINLQQYLYSVIPNEMPVSFGLEALKAQAVAARNYALRPRTQQRNLPYDVTDSVDSQVYFGANTEQVISNRAVDETDNIVALYDKQIILALYHSTSGGMTENYENAFNRPGTKIFPANPLPYLKAVADMPEQKTLENEEDALQYYKSKPQSYEGASPFFRWQRTWTKEELEQVLNKNILLQINSGFVSRLMPYPDELGELKEIKVIQRGKSGKIIRMAVIGDKNVFTIEKELIIRRIFTKNENLLPSANAVFEFETDEDGNLQNIIAYGGGYGHGVGMSQFGAGYLAKNGKTFEQILSHYYTGISVATIPIEIETNKNYSVGQRFYTRDKNAKLKVENLKPNDNLSVSINNSEFIKLNAPKGAPNNLTYILSSYIKEGENFITYQINSNTPLKSIIRVYVELSAQDGNTREY